MSKPKSASSSPAYTSYKTLLSTLDEMKGATIPTKIERTMWPKKSGSAANMLYTSLRFLGLIDDRGVPQPRLRQLIDARGTPEWKATLKAILDDAYKEIASGLNMQAGTASELREAFKERGGLKDGDTLVRSARFFIAAYKDAGVNVSPYFKVSAPRRARKSSSESGGTTQKDAEPSVGGSTEKAKPATGRIRQPIHLDGEEVGYIELPKEYGDDECRSAYAALVYLCAVARVDIQKVTGGAP